MPILETVGGVIESSLALIGRDAFLTGWFDGCKKRIVEERRLPGNHDMVKGIRTAHLCALRYVVNVHKDVIAQSRPQELGGDEAAFSQSIQAFIDERLRRFREHNLDIDVLTLDDLNHVLDDVLKPAAQEGFQPNPEASRRSAITKALAEIEADAGRGSPPLFQQAFTGTLGKAGWYDAFSLYVAEELKTNERFRSIFQAGQVVDLRGSVDQIISKLHAAHADLDTFMGEVRGQLGRIESDVKAVRLTLEEIKADYASELRFVQEAHHATESELISLLAHILEHRVSREDVSGALDQAWQRLADLRRDIGSLKGLANEEPEIAPLVEQANAALSAGDGFSIDGAADALATARIRYLEIIAERDAQAKRDKLNVVQILKKEADIARVRFDYKAAAGLYKELLTLLIDAYGEEHPETAIGYEKLAAILMVQGKAMDAEPLSRKAFDIWNRLHVDDPSNTVSIYQNRAANLSAIGLQEDAEKIIREALDVCENSLGECHLFTISGYINLASNLVQQNRNEEAIESYNRALDLHEMSEIDQKSDISFIYDSMAHILEAEGRTQEAEEKYRRSIYLRENASGFDMTNMAATYNSLGSNLVDQERFVEADAALNKALEINERYLGQGHPETIRNYNNLASSLTRQNRWVEAEEIQVKAMVASKKYLGSNHEITRVIAKNLVDIRSMGRAKGA